jgi:hypothetical protein
MPDKMGKQRAKSSTAAVGTANGVPIADKLVARMKREVRGQVVDIRAVISGPANAAELQRTVVTKEDLAGYHAAHAAYVYCQNQVSVMAELVTALDEMTPFVDTIQRAEDMYMPSGPPMSPLTLSYFTCWAFFDACVGPANETIGTTVLELGTAFGMDGELLRIIRLMQESRMGLYVHEGNEDDLVVLREIGTDAVCRAVVPSGYGGQRGEIWYARLLPPSLVGRSEHVVFTTPYLLVKPGLLEWKAYLGRMLPDGPSDTRRDAYERHMKYGPTRSYWNDFVLEGYVNHRTDVIFLAGLPDIPESRPHSEASERLREA